MPPNRACQVSGGRYGKIGATALAWSIPIAGGQPKQRPPPSAAYPATTSAFDHRTGSPAVRDLHESATKKSLPQSGQRTRANPCRKCKEGLAVKALNRASEHESKATSLEATWSGQRANVDQLKQEIVKLEDELAEFKRNKDFIIAQAKTAEVKKEIYQAKAKIQNDKSADDLMARMKAKAERASFEADAAQEMADSSGGDSMEKEFEGLGTTSASDDVAAKLAAMKAKMG